MTVHELKIAPQWLDRVTSGEKTVEIRKDDRDFQVGDQLKLREWDEAHPNKSIAGHPLGNDRLGYTGRDVLVIVTHVLRHEGLKFGYVALSIRKPLAVIKVQNPGGES